MTLNDDGVETGHRFDTLVVGADGRIVVAWIDKRDLEQASRDGRKYDGAALYYAVSRDEGRTFERNRKLKDGICECCRLAPAVEPGGRVALFWRDILPGGIRDHVLGWIGQDSAAGPVTRVAHDGWAIDACPHHGPSLAISTDGMYHAVWFTGAGPAGPGAFYARSADRGHSFSEPRRVGQPSAQSHAVVFAESRRVWLAWKQSTSPQATGVFVQRSDDDGATWGPAQEIAATGGRVGPSLRHRGRHGGLPLVVHGRRWVSSHPVEWARPALTRSEGPGGPARRGLRLASRRALTAAAIRGHNANRATHEPESAALPLAEGRCSPRARVLAVGRLAHRRAREPGRRRGVRAESGFPSLRHGPRSAATLADSRRSTATSATGSGRCGR